MEGLIIFLGFLLLSAISGWLQKRNQAKEEVSARELEQPLAPTHPTQGESSESAPTSRPRRTLSRDWETELRRLLEGEPAQPVPASPVPQPEPPRIEPKPRATPRPRPAPATAKSSSQPVVRVLKTEPARVSQPRGPSTLSPIEKGSILVSRPITHSLKPVERLASSDKTFVLKQLRHPHTARQAFIATLVFNPPKAMESHEL